MAVTRTWSSISTSLSSAWLITVDSLTFLLGAEDNEGAVGATHADDVGKVPATNLHVRPNNPP